MKKRLLFIPILTMLLLIMSISCKSNPAPAPAPARPPVDRALQDARQRAIDFDAPDYFPSEWETAEAAPSVEGYNDLFLKAVPLYAQAREDEVMAIRDEIKHSGINDEFPEYLRAVDEIALQAHAQYEAEEFVDARVTALRALEEYKTLLTGASAFQARREIIDRGFIDFDRENFERADEIALRAKEQYDAGDRTGYLESVEEALVRYNIVLNNGWISYAAERRTSAAKERELALEEKANIASRAIFREADTLFTQAEEAYTQENFRNAGIHFVDAEARFAVAREDTKIKRGLAEDAIRLAEETLENSGEVAAEAERIIEGGVR